MNAIIRVIVDVSDLRVAVGKSAALVLRGWIEFFGTKLLDRPSRKTSKEYISDRTKTDTGRWGEYPKALERTLVKELGKFTP